MQLPEFTMDTPTILLSIGTVILVGLGLSSNPVPSKNVGKFTSNYEKQRREFERTRRPQPNYKRDAERRKYYEAKYKSQSDKSESRRRQLRNRNERKTNPQVVINMKPEEEFVPPEAYAPRPNPNQPFGGRNKTKKNKKSLRKHNSSKK